jgi:cytochrome oxidase assembly protein ShyY1
MVRKLFTPRWIFIHLGVSLLIFTMMNLGFWQLRRLDEKKALNKAVASRSELPVVPLTTTNLPSLSEWRRVSVTGTYDWNKAVTIINRSTNGSAGYDSLVPFHTDLGAVILVNRGFVPLATKAPAPPSGTLRVVGYLRPSQSRGTLGAIDSTDPTNTEFQRFDIPLIMKHVGSEPYPMYIQLLKESPNENQELPTHIALPELSEGPHLSYAVQWFIFSTTALVAWIVVIRRRLRDTAVSDSAPSGTSA